MSNCRYPQFITAILVAAAMSACQPGQNDDSVAPTDAPVVTTSTESTSTKPAVAADTGAVAASGGKPTAPVQLSYEVLGKPVVGSPVAINVFVESTGENRPVTLQYDIADRSSMVFQQGQVKRLELDNERRERMQQVTVIPQREGRLYVNVSAEVKTAEGSMLRSMAIPIQVGAAPENPVVNGDLVEGPDGETVISMPAKEN